MANISGQLIFDINRNAIIDSDDYGIGNVPIVLQNISTNERLGVYTNSNGNYTFTNVPNGIYRIVLVYNYSGITVNTPAEFINIEIGEIPSANLPPYTILTGSYPSETNTLNAVTPTTVFVTVSNDEDITAETIFIGPARYESINILLDSSATISEFNLLEAVDNGTFGYVEPGTNPNGGPSINPYPGIANDFTFIPQNQPISDGYYSIGNTIEPYPEFFWWRLSDHTTSIETGRMEIVNGGFEGSSFFNTRVNVDFNTDYVFSAWIANIDNNPSQEPPKFGVEITGDTSDDILYNESLGSYFDQNDSVLPMWKQIGTALNTGNNTSVGLSFYSEGGGGEGNDYAVDDVGLRLITYPVISPVKEVDTSFSSVGNTIQYIITIDNTNDNPLTDVMFEDIQPSVLEFITGSVTINDVPYPLYNPNDGFSVLDVQGNTTTTITFSVEVISLPQNSIVANTANITYKYTPIIGGIANSFSKDSNETTVYIGRAIIGGETSPDTSFEKLVDKDTAQVGDILTYTIFAQNIGNVEATNIKIYDVIPSGTRYVENTITASVDFTGSPLTSIDLINPLQPGNQVIIGFQVEIDTITDSNLIQNTANIIYNYTLNPDEINGATGNSTTNTVNTLVSNTSISILKSQNISNAIVGDEVTYSLTVENTGNIDFIDTIVKDNLDPQLTFIPNSLTIGGVSSSENIVTGVDLGILGIGDNIVLTFKAIVNDILTTSTIINNATVTYSALIGESTINFTATSNNVELNVYTPSIEISKVSSKQEVYVGGTFTYTINITNNSELNISNVILYDDLPLQFRIISISINEVVLDTSQLNELNIGDLYSGEVSNIVVTILALSNNLSDFKNTITAIGTVQINTANPPKTVSALATDTQSITIIEPNQSMYIEKLQNISDAIVGDIVTYILIVTNTGNTVNYNVNVEDKLVSQLTFIQESLTINDVPSNLDITTGVNIGNLDIDEYAILIFKAKVNNALQNSTITNYASTNYDVIIGGSINNYTINSNIVSLNTYNVGIVVEITSSESIVYVGETFNYTIIVTNNGDIEVSDVTLLDDLPPQLEVISISIDGLIIGETQLNGLNIGNLSVGQSTIIVVTVYVISNTLNNFRNTITVRGIAQANYANSPTVVSSSATDNNSVTTINPNLSICISKLESTCIATVGKTIIYTLIVKNTGNMIYENTIVQDPLSLQLNFVENSLSINGVLSNEDITTGVNIGTLNINQEVRLNFKAVVNSIYPNSIISNNANVRYSVVRKSNTTNLSSYSNTVYLRLLDSKLNIIKEVDKNKVCIGDIITYTIKVENIGHIDIGSNKTPLVLFDKLSECVEFINDSLSINGKKVNNKDIKNGIILGTIGIGDMIIIEYKVKVCSRSYDSIKNKSTIMYGIRGIEGFIVIDFVEDNKLIE